MGTLGGSEVDVDWLQLLSSATLGSVLGLLAKEVLDALREKRAHRAELQKRYFDTKLDATLRAVRQIKTASSTLRTFVTIVRENEDTNGWIEPNLLNSVTRSMTAPLQRINDETAGVISLLGFYYDDDMVQLVESATPTPLLQKISEFIFRIGEILRARAVLDSTPPPPAQVQTAAQTIITTNEQELKGNIADLEKLAGALDQLANKVVGRMRENYKDVKF